MADQIASWLFSDSAALGHELGPKVAHVEGRAERLVAGSQWQHMGQIFNNRYR